MLMSALGYIDHIIHNEDHIQITEVIVNGQTAKAINYPVVCGRVFKGDAVLVNTTAVELSLGTGGYHYVMGRVGKQNRGVGDHQPDSHPCSSDSETLNKIPSPASVMKLRYTPAQFACQVEEEGDGPLRSALHDLKGNELEGIPILVGELHSMLPAACLSIRSITEKPVRICYIMTDGASLPLALSRHVRHLQRLGLITGTITYGHAFGGGTECVNIYSALVAAVCIWRADIIIVAPGPGVVGTGTALGFSGMEQVSIMQAVHHLKGMPILIPRVSLHEPRERHYGISHHTSTVLRFLSDIPLYTPLEKHPLLLNQWAERAPSERHKLTIYTELDGRVWPEATSSYPEVITTMGRDYKKDPLFFRHVYYASALACHMLDTTG